MTKEQEQALLLQMAKNQTVLLRTQLEHIGRKMNPKLKDVVYQSISLTSDIVELIEHEAVEARFRPKYPFPRD